MNIDERVEQLEQEVEQLKKQIQCIQKEIRKENIIYSKAGRKSKFSEDKKHLIYCDLKDNHLSYDQLAKKYDCAKGTIHNIVKEEQEKEMKSDNLIIQVIRKN